MNITEETYHLINSYLSGELKGRKLDKFKAKMRDEAEFKALVEQQKEIIQSIEDYREQELKQVLKNGLKDGTVPMFGKVKLVLSTAAAIALIVAAYILVPKLINTSDEPLVTDTENELDPGSIEPKVEKEPLPITEIDTQTLAIADVKVPELEPASEVSELDTIADSSRMNQLNGAKKPIISNADSLTLVETTAVNDTPDNVEEKTKNLQTENESSEEDLDGNILSDELLERKTYAVLSISPDFVLENDEYQEAETTVLKSRNKKKEAVAEEPLKSSRNIKVEYWNSVVNFRGYQYNGAVVRLYSIPTSKSLGFKELDERLYVKMDDQFYFIEKGNKHKRLVAVTSPTLLKVLKD